MGFLSRRIIVVLMVVCLIFSGKGSADQQCPECLRENPPTPTPERSDSRATKNDPTLEALPKPFNGLPPTLENLSADLAAEKFKNIIVMCGAGCSAAANISDFNQLMFNYHIERFRWKPKRFYSKVRKTIPFEHPSPTKTHKFLKLLHDKNMLRRVYTENVDALELLVGLPEEKVLMARGTYENSYCINKSCGERFDYKWFKKELFAFDSLEAFFVDLPKLPRCWKCHSVAQCPRCQNVPTCPSCLGLVRPDVRFTGEDMPKRFYDYRQKDFESCDLLLVLGTHLDGGLPFASLVNRPAFGVPRIYINSEMSKKEMPYLFRKVANLIDWLFGVRSTFSFKETYDLSLAADCDETIGTICDIAKWKEELDQIQHENLES